MSFQKSGFNQTCTLSGLKAGLRFSYETVIPIMKNIRRTLGTIVFLASFPFAYFYYSSNHTDHETGVRVPFEVLDEVYSHTINTKKHRDTRIYKYSVTYTTETGMMLSGAINHYRIEDLNEFQVLYDPDNPKDFDIRRLKAEENQMTLFISLLLWFVLMSIARLISSGKVSRNSDLPAKR